MQDCGAELLVRQEELDLGSTPASQEELKQGRAKSRIDTLLRDQAQVTTTLDLTNVSTQIHLRFLCNPIRFLPHPDDPSMVGSVVCERTTLEGESGHQTAIGTGVEETLDADLVRAWQRVASYSTFRRGYAMMSDPTF